MCPLLDQSDHALIAEVERRVQARELGWVSRPSAPVCRIQTALYGIGLHRGWFSARRLPADPSVAYGLIWEPRAHALASSRAGLLVLCGLTVHLLPHPGLDEWVLVITDPDPKLIAHTTCRSGYVDNRSHPAEPAPELAPWGQV